MIFFGTVRQKNFNRETWYSPSLIHSVLLLPETFWKNEEFPMKVFGTLIQHIFDGIWWSSLLSSIQFFRSQSFSETPKCSQLNSLVLSYENKQRQNVISSALIHTVFLIPETFWNNEKFPMKIFGIVRQKNPTQNRDTCSSFSYIILFRYPKISRRLKSYTQNFSTLWEKKK